MLSNIKYSSSFVRKLHQCSQKCIQKWDLGSLTTENWKPIRVHFSYLIWKTTVYIKPDKNFNNNKLWNSVRVLCGLWGCKLMPRTVCYHIRLLLVICQTHIRQLCLNASHQQRWVHRTAAIRDDGQALMAHSSQRLSQPRRSTELTSCCELAAAPAHHVEIPANHSQVWYARPPV